MKLPAGINNWGIAALGVVCSLLVVNLVAQYRDMQPGRSSAHFVAAASKEPQSRPVKVSSHVADDLAKYDPTVHFDTLKSLDSRPMPDEERNPFQFVGEVTAPAAVARAAAGPVVAAAPAAPPPPPPPPIKAMGYNELPGGQKEAMMSFNDDMLVVHEGDTVGTKYKVIAIDPGKVVVQDGETNKTIELPFPQ